MQITTPDKPPVRSRQKPLCFRSDERYFCHRHNCPWRRECLRLVAEWRR